MVVVTVAVTAAATVAATVAAAAALRTASVSSSGLSTPNTALSWRDYLPLLTGGLVVSRDFLSANLNSLELETVRTVHFLRACFYLLLFDAPVFQYAISSSAKNVTYKTHKKQPLPDI